MLQRIANPKLASRFLFKSEPIFGKYWIVPEVLEGEPWQRVGDGFDLLAG